MCLQNSGGPGAAGVGAARRRAAADLNGHLSVFKIVKTKVQKMCFFSLVHPILTYRPGKLCETIGLQNQLVELSQSPNLVRDTF